MPKSIIQYDAYEISPCLWQTEDNGGDRYFHAIESTKNLSKEERKRLVFTLYGHITDEGAQAIGDFLTWEDAVDTYQKITGCSIRKKWRNTRLIGLEIAPGKGGWSTK